MQKHCIRDMFFISKIPFITHKHSAFYTQLAQWQIIVKDNVSQLCYVLIAGRRKLHGL